MLPRTLALIDDDFEYTEFLADFLRTRDIEVGVYADSNDLIVDPHGHDYGFYVLDLMLPGVDGVNLIKLLRRRTDAGIVVVSGRLGAEVFQDVIAAGADMYLTKPVQFEHVLLAIEAVHRRVGGAAQASAEWVFDRRARQLVAPDGARIDLSEADLALVECFAAAEGEVVTRDALRQRLGKPDDGDTTDGLNATIYRLRRRIERATPAPVPLHTKSRVGYVFRAALKAA